MIMVCQASELPFSPHFRVLDSLFPLVFNVENSTVRRTLHTSSFNLDRIVLGKLSIAILHSVLNPENICFIFPPETT